MKVVVIKFEDGTYYTGHHLATTDTLLKARLYPTKRVAENMIKKHFPDWYQKRCTVINIEINEVDE